MTLTDEERALARRAAEAYDAVLAGQPELAHQELADAAVCVVRLRDALIARRRAEGVPSETLSRVNALVSSAYSAQYPVAGVRWDRMTATRDALRALL